MTQDSLAALRAEVEAAFEEATLQIGSFADAAPQVTHEIAPEVVEIDALGSTAPAETAPFVPPAPVAMSTPPPPPPPPPAPVAQMPVAPSVVWKSAFEDAPIANDDPLVAFAPPPRMDWGPERQGRFRRNR